MDWFAFRLQAVATDRQLERLFGDTDPIEPIEPINVVKREPSLAIERVDVNSMEAGRDGDDAYSTSTESDDLSSDSEDYFQPLSPKRVKKSEAIDDINFVCEQCGRKCQNLRGLKRHRAVHKEPSGKPRKKKQKQCGCSLCDDSFTEQNALEDHMKEKHPEEYEAEVQNLNQPASDSDSEDFIPTLSTRGKVIDELNCVCDYCGKKCQNQRGLRTHRNVHKEARSILCKFVLSLSDAPAGPQVQVKGCSLCDDTFADRNTLVEHMKEKHPEEWEVEERQPKVVECDLCEKVFTKIKYLKKHKSLLHPRATIFRCSLCDTKFSSHEATLVHVKEQHPTEFKEEELKNARLSAAKSFQCKQCEMTFSVKTDFKYHMRSHHTDTHPHACTLCDFRCETGFSLRRHVETIHV